MIMMEGFGLMEAMSAFAVSNIASYIPSVLIRISDWRTSLGQWTGFEGRRTPTFIQSFGPIAAGRNMLDFGQGDLL